MNTLEIKNVVKEFKISKKQKKNRKLDVDVLVAVNDVSFALKSGRIYGLLGPNGAGKTTTLRMIASLIEPKSGQIIYNGKNINDDIYSYRSKVGFLTSELKLDDFFTPDYTFDYMCKLYGLNEEEIAKRKDELFSKFGVDQFRFVKIKELSTGMKQKVSLAISLCHNPDIIIFDEPTNGLDIVAAREVENFLTYLKTENKIILLSTHIFSLVEKLCDDVGIIINGKLILEDSLEHLTKDKSLEEVFFDNYKEVE
jgi:sodium transport system ATP-binding protein